VDKNIRNCKSPKSKAEIDISKKLFALFFADANQANLQAGSKIK
jgi:hypothetical protein